MRLSQGSRADGCSTRSRRAAGASTPAAALRVRATARFCSASRSASSRDAATRASSTARRSGESDPSASAASSAMSESPASSRRRSLIDTPTLYGRSRSSSVEADASARRNDPVLADGSERVSRVRASDAALARRRPRRAREADGRELPGRPRQAQGRRARGRATSRTLIADGRDVVTIEHDRRLRRPAARATEEAIRRGADVIYQACFVDGAWRGFADFVERQPDGSYEVVDTKLARHSKPSYVLQLCFYSEQVARIQGAPAGPDARRARHARAGEPARRRLPRVLPPRARPVRRRGRGRDRRLPRCRCRSARAATSRAGARAAGSRTTTSASSRGCGGDQAIRLDAAGIAHGRGARRRARRGSRPPTMAPRTFETLREQAAMQVAARSGGHTWKVLAPEPKRGFELLPPPSARRPVLRHRGRPVLGAGRGLEYLWGIVDTARRVHAVLGARPRAGAPGRRGRDRPDPRALAPPIRAMHVYHYAAYEVTALKRLTCEYGTREDELDELLRAEVFVDLYKVVSQGLRLSHARYGLKQVETFYFERHGRPARRRRLDRALRGLARAPRPGGSSTTSPTYNEEDCVSTLRAARLAAAAATGAGAAARAAGAARSARRARRRPRSCAQALLAGLPDDPHELAEADRPRWLLAQLLLYHRREAKPVWWAFFDKIGRTSEELQERDSEAIGGLEQAGPPIGSASSLVWPFRFPAQQHHLGPGDDGLRPGDRQAGRDDRGARRRGRARCSLRRGPIARGRAAAGGAHPRRPVPTPEQQAALRRLARSVLAGDGALSARPGRSSSASRSPAPLAAGRPRRGEASSSRGLDGRHLVIQGPPGSGKTYTGARLIAHLIGLGRRVGVTSTSHKAIHNLIAEVERRTGVAVPRAQEGRLLREPAS